MFLKIRNFFVFFCKMNFKSCILKPKKYKNKGYPAFFTARGMAKKKSKEKRSEARR